MVFIEKIASLYGWFNENCPWMWWCTITICLWHLGIHSCFLLCPFLAMKKHLVTPQDPTENGRINPTGIQVCQWESSASPIHYLAQKTGRRTLDLNVKGFHCCKRKIHEVSIGLGLRPIAVTPTLSTAWLLAQSCFSSCSHRTWLLMPLLGFIRSGHQNWFIENLGWSAMTFLLFEQFEE